MKQKSPAIIQVMLPRLKGAASFFVLRMTCTEKGRAQNIATHDNRWTVPWEQNNTQLGGAILSDTKYPPIPKGDNLWFENCPQLPPHHAKNRAAKLAAIEHKPKFHLLVQKVQKHISNIVTFWHSRPFLEGLLYIITFSAASLTWWYTPRPVWLWFSGGGHDMIANQV